MVQTLTQRLEQGPGSRELSDEFLISRGWVHEFSTYRGTRKQYRWLTPESKYCSDELTPNPTLNTDDALAMAGEYWYVVLADVMRQLREHGHPVDMALDNLKRLPLAICAAISRIE